MSQPGEVVVIVNPMCGPGPRDANGRGRRRAAVARAVLAAERRTGRVEVTQYGGHARELAQAASSAGASLIAVWGGDGTVNETGSALAFGRTALGIVPVGSGNGLARALGISLDPERAMRQALAGVPRAIDVGEIAGRLFFNVAGIGFDAHVARLFNQPARRRGFSRYVATSLTELFRYEPRTYTLSLNGQTIRRRALMVVLANGSQYGNGARVAPAALLDDGLIDLVVIAPQSPIANVLRARYLFDGTIARRPGVLLERVEHVSIDNGSSPMGFHADGESFEHSGPLELRVHRAALSVIVPGAF